MTQVTDRLATWMDERTRARAVFAHLRGRVTPERWTGLLWQVVVHSFVVVAITGVFLMFFYDPSSTPVVYDGSYQPLQGVEMSRALESTLQLSFDVRGGLLVRQLHNWGSSLMIAALIVHILSVFFTGAFRKPRELTWVALFLILFVAMATGLTGSVLPDDLLSSNSLAVLDGVLKSIPFVGAWLSALIFQGSFPSGAISTFYPLHVIVLPAVLAALILFVGVRGLLARAGGMFFIVVGLLTAISALVTVNPVATYGPADPGNASAGSGAVWYLAFLDGAQRLVPSGWEFEWLDRTWTLSVLVPVTISGLFLFAGLLYPFAEGWITNDKRMHLVPDRLRNMPTRTAIGVAAMVFYGVLWAAAGSDVIALTFRLTGEGVILTLQLLLLAGPPLAFILTKRVCLALQRKDRDIALHGFETGRIVRLPGGEYLEVHQEVSAAERRRLTEFESPEPSMIRPHSDGRIRVQDRLRAVLSRWMYADRLSPIGQRELDGAEGRTPLGESETDRPT